MDLLFNVEIYALSCLYYETKFCHSPLLSWSSKSGIIQRIVAVPPPKCEVNVHRHHSGTRSREEGSIFFARSPLWPPPIKQYFPPPSLPFPPVLRPSQQLCPITGASIGSNQGLFVPLRSLRGGRRKELMT